MAQTSSNYNTSANNNVAAMNANQSKVLRTTNVSPTKMNFSSTGGGPPGVNLMPNQSIAGASSSKQGGINTT